MPPPTVQCAICGCEVSKRKSVYSDKFKGRVCKEHPEVAETIEQNKQAKGTEVKLASRPDTQTLMRQMRNRPQQYRVTIPRYAGIMSKEELNRRIEADIEVAFHTCHICGHSPCMRHPDWLEIVTELMKTNEGSFWDILIGTDQVQPTSIHQFFCDLDNAHPETELLHSPVLVELTKDITIEYLGESTWDLLVSKQTASTVLNDTHLNLSGQVTLPACSACLDKTLPEGVSNLLLLMYTVEYPSVYRKEKEKRASARCS